MTDIVVQPILRWAGSKRGMLPLLRQYLPTRFGRYIEPFAGSACLLFSIAPQHAVIGDLNSDLVEMYKSVASRPRVVGKRLAELPTGKRQYYKIREIDPATLNSTERAARFIYLNRFCFNGLYRTNRSGQFNVPYGAPKTINVPTETQLTDCAKILRSCSIIHGDFEAIVRKSARSGDFVYLDPPFFTYQIRTFREYNSKPFAADDLDRLCALLGDLKRKSCSFLVSYAYCPEAQAAFKRYDTVLVHTRRNISGFPQHRGPARELLVRYVA